LYACFMIVQVTWMSFASVARELRRDILSMLETHILMSYLVFCLALTLALHLTLLLVSLSHFSHGPNHGSYVFGSRENNFVPRRFGYDPHSHRGDHFSCMLGFLLEGLTLTLSCDTWTIHVFSVMAHVPLG
jgi:hypothetical protein